MTIRLKVVRRQEEQARKIGELMNMYSIKVPSYPNYNYQPIMGGSTLPSWTSPYIDPRIQKTKDLFQMFQIDR